MPKQECRNCRFWERLTENDMSDFDFDRGDIFDNLPEDDPERIFLGRCERYPPVVLGIAVGAFVNAEADARHSPEATSIAAIKCGSVFPISDECAWCGEWKPLTKDDSVELDPAERLTRLFDFGLGIKALNVMEKAGIETISELREALRNPAEVLRWIGCGPKTMKEMQDALAKFSDTAAAPQTPST